MTSASPTPLADEPAVPRRAGRMLLVDADERVLLMNELRDIGSAQAHWITPGGGVEAGESPAQAAVRELYEETGLYVELPADTSATYQDQVTFRFAGHRYAQTNDYFLVRVPSGLRVEPAAQTSDERLVVLGHRWWSLPELAASGEAFEPLDIVGLIRRELAVD